GAGAGNGTVDGDTFWRPSPGGAARRRRLADQPDPTTRDAVDAFVDGFNGWIAAATQAGALPVEYAATHSTPRPWSAQDVVAVGMLTNFQVGTTGADELFTASVLADQMTRLGPVHGAAPFADRHWPDDPSAPTTI